MNIVKIDRKYYCRYKKKDYVISLVGGYLWEVSPDATKYQGTLEECIDYILAK